MPSPFDRRFLFVTGKGGVGKSTVAAALAVAQARRGRRVLLATSGATERLSTLFGVDPFTTEVRPIAPGIWGTRVEVDSALREYGGMALKSRTVFNAVFDNQLVHGFLAGVPGLHEWAILGKVWYHSTEEDADGRPRFDTVIQDAPATGHGLEMLRVPKVIVDLVPPGRLRRDAERAWHDLTDPKRAGIVVVTLPEELPTTEALELVDALTNELGLGVAALVVNGVLESLFTEGEREALRALLPAGVEAWAPVRGAIQVGLASAARRAAREALQAEQLARLANVDAPRVDLPFLLDDATTPAAAVELSKRLG
jgi:anion-transporting  ArsA/GET3 family ATPase